MGSRCFHVLCSWHSTQNKILPGVGIVGSRPVSLSGKMLCWWQDSENSAFRPCVVLSCSPPLAHFFQCFSVFQPVTATCSGIGLSIYQLNITKVEHQRQNQQPTTIKNAINIHSQFQNWKASEPLGWHAFGKLPT